MTSKWEEKKLKGNEEFRKKNYLSAVGLYTEAIQIDPSQDTLYNNRGLCFMNLDNLERAKDDLKQAISLNPKNVKALKRLGIVNLQQGELQEAYIYFKRCVDIEPNEILHKEELKLCEELIDKKKELDKLKFVENDWNKCLEISSKLIEKCKKCFEIKLIYFQSLIQTFNIDKGLKYYRNNFNQNEQNNEELQFILINAYFIDGKYDKAKQFLINLLSRTQDNKLIAKTNKLAKKLEEIQKEKDKANECFKNNNFDEAINKYTNLLSMDTNNKLFNALILSNRALCYYKKKELFKALHDINSSIKLNGNYWKSYRRRANINIELKYSEQAKDDLKKVLELDPLNKEAISLLDDIQKEERMSKKRDFYKLLNVNKFSSQDEIRRNFKKLVIKWHPDKNNQSEEQKEYAEKMFKDINEAYSILSDEKKKQIYDNGGHPDDPNSEFYSKAEQDRTNNFSESSYKKKRRERTRDKY
jgi:DnaJ family protein C protein 7